jgi:hypothetical protein
LCSWHHRAVHRGEITIKGNADLAGGLTILNKWGKPMTAKPKPLQGRAPTGRWVHPPGESFDQDCVYFHKASAA